MKEGVTIPQISIVVLTPFYPQLYITTAQRLPRQSSAAHQFTYNVNRVTGVYRDSTKIGSKWRETYVKDERIRSWNLFPQASPASHVETRLPSSSGKYR